MNPGNTQRLLASAATIGLTDTEIQALCGVTPGDLAGWRSGALTPGSVTAAAIRSAIARRRQRLYRVRRVAPENITILWPGQGQSGAVPGRRTVSIMAILDDAATGMSRQEIAERHGLSIQSLGSILHQARKRGLAVPRIASRPVYDSAEIVRRSHAGESASQIAAAMGCTPQHVRNVLRRAD